MLFLTYVTFFVGLYVIDENVNLVNCNPLIADGTHINDVKNKSDVSNRIPYFDFNE